MLNENSNKNIHWMERSSAGIHSRNVCSEKNTFSQRETSALSQWEVILRPWYVLPTAVSLFSWGLWSPDRLILWSLMWT